MSRIFRLAFVAAFGLSVWGAIIGVAMTDAVVLGSCLFMAVASVMIYISSEEITHG